MRRRRRQWQERAAGDSGSLLPLDLLQAPTPAPTLPLPGP